MTWPRTGFPYLDDPWDDGQFSPLAMAHRGGARHPELPGPENSLAAFEHAVGLGYRYLETDVHASRDGVLFAFHDDDLTRLTGQAGSIASLHSRDVAALQLQGPGGRGHAVPRLAELLEHFPRARFNIDLKSPGAAVALATELSRGRWHDRVCVGSFDAPTLREFTRASQVAVLTSGTPVDVVGHLLALPGLVRAPLDRVVSRLQGQGAGVLQVPARRGVIPVVTEAFVARVHALGKHVHVWTIDQPDQMRALLDLGVDGLITDRTDHLRTVMSDRGHWRPS